MGMMTIVILGAAALAVVAFGWVMHQRGKRGPQGTEEIYPLF